MLQGILALDHAACVLVEIDPIFAPGMLQPRDRLAVDRKIIHLVEAIQPDEREHPRIATVPLPEDEVAKRGDSIYSNIHMALFMPADKGLRLILEHDEIYKLARCGIYLRELKIYAAANDIRSNLLFDTDQSMRAYARHASDANARRVARNTAAWYSRTESWPPAHEKDEALDYICLQVAKLPGDYKRATVKRWVRDLFPDSYSKPGPRKKTPA